MWIVLLTVMLPRGVGELLLGDLWVPAAALVPPVGALIVIGCFEVAAAAGVRALAASRRSLTAQVSSSTLYLLAGAIGAELGGAKGSCWGVAAAAAVGVLVWWYHLRRAIAERISHEATLEVHTVGSAGR